MIWKEYGRKQLWPNIIAWEKPQKVPGLPFSRRRFSTVVLQAVHTLLI